MKKFFRDWWQELLLLVLSAVLFVLGVQLDLAQGLTLTDVAGILAAVMGFTAAATSFSNKIELQKQLRAVERRTADQLSADLQDILEERLHGITAAQIRFFDDKEAFGAYRKEREAAVRRTISTTELNDPTKPAVSSASGSSAYAGPLHQKLVQEGITYRRVEIVHNVEQLDHLVRKMEQLKDCKYYVGCYTGVPPDVPLLDCMIFDEDEVCIGGYRGRDWAQGEYNVAIRDPKVVRMLQGYFNLLYDRSVKLNGGKGDEIYYDRVDTMRQKITKLSKDAGLIFLEGRKRHYEIATLLIREMLADKKGTRLLFTGFGKTMLVADPEDPLKRAFDAVIEAGFQTYRIKRCDTLDEVKAKTAMYMGVKNYQLGVIVRPSGTPYYDLLIVEGHTALLTFSSDPYQPTVADSAFLFSDPQSVRFLEQVFWAMWRDTTVVRPEGGKVDKEAMERLKKQLQASPGLNVQFTRRSRYDLMLKDLEQAKVLIEIISFHQLSNPDSRREKYYETLYEVMERGVQHRRLVWNLDHLFWLEERFANGWGQIADFSVRFLPLQQEQDLTTFDLIDENIVLMAQGWAGSGHLRMIDYDIALLFKSYFKNKWERAAQYPIKEAGKPPDMELLARLKDNVIAGTGLGGNDAQAT